MTADKCNGCIYYDYMYLICKKPYLAYCPKEMELTTNKCIGCIYYTKVNTYTTSPSTTRDELVEKYGAYYSCSKPYLVKCPRESGCIAEKSSIPIKTHRCIICDNNCMDSVCDECKEAIKRLKEMLNNDK